MALALSESPTSTYGNVDICKHAAGPGFNPGFTKKALSQTKSWRCPNLDYVSAGLRKVASCYQARGEKDKAKLQLENILNNETITECISEEESLRVSDKIEELD
ncbi:MAG TPA: hypothetical protein VNJ01_14155 [Bacteriovoracaceae bacterium]|nr:hypothetical protein [Bacteriovoracaceae bacterium]